MPVLRWRAETLVVASEAAVAMDWARGAAVATAVGALGHPLADRVAAAVVADDLIDGINRATAGGVANDALIVAPVSFCSCRDGDADSGNGGEDGECFFHGV